MGTLSDVEFDPDSGQVTSLVLDGERRVPASSLIGIGSYALVVAAPPDST